MTEIGTEYPYIILKFPSYAGFAYDGNHLACSVRVILIEFFALFHHIDIGDIDFGRIAIYIILNIPEFTQIYRICTCRDCYMFIFASGSYRVTIRFAGLAFNYICDISRVN